jgi:hypothetical protein
MTDALREAAQAALDTLEGLQGGCTDSDDGTVEAITVWCPEIIDALRAALSAPPAVPPVPAGMVLDVDGLMALAEKMMRDSWATGDDSAWQPAAEKLRAALAAAAQPVPATGAQPVELQLWCDTCEGTGRVHQESQRGVPGSGGEFKCPDCDGNGYIKSRRYVLAGASPTAPTGSAS